MQNLAFSFQLQFTEPTKLAKGKQPCLNRHIQIHNKQITV